MTTCLYCNNKHSKEELEAKDAEIARLTKIIIRMTRTARIALQEALVATDEI